MPKSGDGDLWPTTDDDKPSGPAEDGSTQQLPVPDQQEEPPAASQAGAGWFDPPRADTPEEPPAGRDEPHAKPAQQRTQPVSWPVAELEKHIRNANTEATSFVRPLPPKPSENPPTWPGEGTSAPKFTQSSQTETSSQRDDPPSFIRPEKAAALRTTGQQKSDQPPADRDSTVAIPTGGSGSEPTGTDSTPADQIRETDVAGGARSGQALEAEVAGLGHTDQAREVGMADGARADQVREVVAGGARSDQPRESGMADGARADQVHEVEAGGARSDQARESELAGRADQTQETEGVGADQVREAEPAGRGRADQVPDAEGAGGASVDEAREAERAGTQVDQAREAERADRAQPDQAREAGAASNGRADQVREAGRARAEQVPETEAGPASADMASSTRADQAHETDAADRVRADQGHETASQESHGWFAPQDGKPEQPTSSPDQATKRISLDSVAAGRTRQESDEPRTTRPDQQKQTQPPPAGSATVNLARPGQPDRTTAGQAPGHQDSATTNRAPGRQSASRPPGRQDGAPGWAPGGQGSTTVNRAPGRQDSAAPGSQDSTAIIRIPDRKDTTAGRPRLDQPPARPADSATVNLARPSLLKPDAPLLKPDRQSEWPPPEPPRSAPQRIGPPPEPPATKKAPRKKLLVTAIAVVAVIGIAAGVVFGVPGLSEKLGLTGEDAVAIDPPPAPISYTPGLRGPDAGAPAPTKQGVDTALAGPIANPALGTITGIVIDPATSENLYERDATSAITPASTGKILTAAAALLSLDHTKQLVTKVVQGDQLGEVIIVGGGDPTISSLEPGNESMYPGAAHLSELVEQVKNSGTQVQTVYIDQSRYAEPKLAPSWLPADIGAGYIAPIVPAMLDGDRRDATVNYSPRTTDPGRTLVTEFAARLGASPASSVEKKAPENAKVLGEIRSAPMTQLVDNMLDRSDNTLGDIIAHEVAIQAGEEPSFDGASKAMLDVLRQNNFDVDGVALKDGSGMSEQNKVSAKLLAQILAVAAGPDGKDPRTTKLRPLLGGLPVAGGSGTLADRYDEGTATAGRGWVRAKTGTLTGVNSLAGIVLDKDNRPLVFAFLTTGTTNTARPALDAVAAALRSCGCQ